MLYAHVLRPLLFQFDSETVHHWVSRGCVGLCSIAAVQKTLSALCQVSDPVNLFGLTFPNRVGLAAGFDKNGHFVAAAEALGFGHIEVGAVTPYPQEGHPRPRMFRLKELEALRNRMGFNNDGAVAIAHRLEPRRAGIPLGINLGKQKETPLEAAAGDYGRTLQMLFRHADFFVLNLSSPNTEGLRTLQSELATVLRSVGECNEACSQETGLPRRPILIKISPDLETEALRRLAQSAAQHGAAGLVATNTTASREGSLQGIDSLGGVSGRPLSERSRRVVATLRAELGPAFPLIGVGGIHDPESALAMLDAGADLIQIYTGLIYEGPGLPRRLAAALKEGTA